MTGLGQGLEEILAIHLVVEDVLPAIATTHDVVDGPGYSKRIWRSTAQVSLRSANNSSNCYRLTPFILLRDFEMQPDGDGARLRQTAMFDPVGLWGLAYWYGVWPLHQVVFAGMLRGLARSAERNR